MYGRAAEGRPLRRPSAARWPAISRAPAANSDLSVTVELCPDLTTGVELAVHVDVRHAVPHRLDQLAELASADALSCRADHVRGRDRAGDHGRWRWTGLGARRSVAEVRADEEADATGLRRGTEVDMRLKHGRFQVVVGQ